MYVKIVKDNTFSHTIYIIIVPKHSLKIYIVIVILTIISLYFRLRESDILAHTIKIPLFVNGYTC